MSLLVRSCHFVLSCCITSCEVTSLLQCFSIKVKVYSPVSSTRTAHCSPDFTQLPPGHRTLFISSLLLLLQCWCNVQIKMHNLHQVVVFLYKTREIFKGTISCLFSEWSSDKHNWRYLSEVSRSMTRTVFFQIHLTQAFPSSCLTGAFSHNMWCLWWYLCKACGLQLSDTKPVWLRVAVYWPPEWVLHYWAGKFCTAWNSRDKINFWTFYCLFSRVSINIVHSECNSGLTLSAVY